MIHNCPYCDYESTHKWVVKRHIENKHENQQNEPQLKTSYMQGYPQEQPVYHGQVAHQQPVHHDQVVHPPNTQINPQQNALVTRNQYLQNKVIELQSLLRNQNVQTDQTFPFRKRFKLNDENESETLSDVMGTDKHSQDFLSESDSEESDTNVGHEFEDIITDIYISYTNILGLRKKYLKVLEKYNEIEDEDKRDIFKKYINLKGRIWMEWYDYEEEDDESGENEDNDGQEENSEDDEYENEESEEEGKQEGTTRCGQEDEEEDGEEEEEGEEEEGEEEGEEEDGDGEDQGLESGKVNDEDHDKNHLMDFVLKLESVADEDDKIYIERLWKKQLNRITVLKDAQIDSNETDSENEDEDTCDRLTKNKNIIKKIIEEFDERGNNYFKHCNKEKIETISTWCNELLNNQSKMIKNTEILNNVKKTLTPVRSNIRKLTDLNYPISKRRKLL